MKKLTLTSFKDEKTFDLVKKSDQRTLAVWAIDCAERVMPYFEKEYPDDTRPRDALNVLCEWVKTGEFHMAVIRKASLDSHASAKEVGNESPAASAAHAAGQAVATAHVKTHSIGAAIYAQQAIYRAKGLESEVKKEQNWQFEHLRDLSNQSKKV